MENKQDHLSYIQKEDKQVLQEGSDLSHRKREHIQKIGTTSSYPF
jgi:hypothetical protein